MINRDAKLGKNVRIYHPELVNLYRCEVGDNTSIGAFVEVGEEAKIGKNCKVQAFAFIPQGVIIEDNVFVGPHVCFINDKFPRATVCGKPKARKDWKIEVTSVKEGASIGANATILCGVTIGRHSMVAAGSVVTKDVPTNTIVAGNPARVIRRI